MKTVNIYNYSGYRHNRYDGYNSSRGILAACGGTGTADCFADDDDIDIDETIFYGKNPIDWEIVLGNLDCTNAELEELIPGENNYTEHIEYWGDPKIVFRFEKMENGEIHVFFDNEKNVPMEYIVKF